MSVKAAASSIPKAVKAGLVLSRVPIVTPELNALENKYYQYQAELERRLMWTFPSYFYFKKGTLAERRFQSVQKGVISKQPGVWFPKGVPDVRHNRERSQKQDIMLPREASEGSNKSDVSRPIVPNSRTTKADENNDITSLDRKLDRTLHLLVKDDKGSWVLPSFPVDIEAKEGKKASLFLSTFTSLFASDYSFYIHRFSFLKELIPLSKAKDEGLVKDRVIKSIPPIEQYKAPKYPIVLCHGLSGFDKLILIPSIFQLTKMIKASILSNHSDSFMQEDDDKDIQSDALVHVDYWIGVREALEARGCTVITAKVPS